MVSVDRSSRRSRRMGVFLSARTLICLGLSVMLLFGIQTSVLLGTEPRTSSETTQISPVPHLRANEHFSQCRYYLAESAIPNGGLGIFTAVGINKDDFVGSPTLDICIYVVDTPKRTPFETHSWGQDVFFGQFEGRKPRAACEGFATLYNAMPAPHVANSKLVSMRVPTNGGLTRYKNPGAGAITHYYGVHSIAQDTISAGSELTIDYGDWSFDENVKYQKPIRTVEWLQENGMCIDNIEIKQATDPEMGRGAFATRLLKKGSLVAPAPLQAFPNRSAFAQQTPEALFVNYCFQPKDSDMLLFPYGPGINLINHSHRKPNVELRWSTHNMHHSEWLQMDPSKLLDVAFPGGLILEVVAARDIRPGEELFLDYGPDWEEAWKKHVKEWKPVADASEYVYPASMDETGPLRTVKEQKTTPYPKNLATICNTPDWEREKNNTVKWVEPVYPWPEGFVYCHILERVKGDHGDDVYTVSLDFDDDPEYDPTIDMMDRYIDLKVPRRAIRFVDKPYTSDQHLPNAFRHTIELPSKLVPTQWVSKS